MRTDLLSRWVDLVDHPLAVDAGRHLIHRWEEAHRRYHDVAHLAAVLDRVDELAGEAAHADVVRLAAFFHDAVYDPRSATNEEQSAVLAETVLSDLRVHRTTVDHVAGLRRDWSRGTSTGDGRPDEASA